MTPNERGAEQTVAVAHSTQPSINSPSIWTTAACRRPKTWRLGRVSNLRNKLYLIIYSSFDTLLFEISATELEFRTHLPHPVRTLFCARKGSFVVAAAPTFLRFPLPPCFCCPLLLAAAVSADPSYFLSSCASPATPNGHIDHSQVCLPDSTHPFLLRVA